MFVVPDAESDWSNSWKRVTLLRNASQIKANAVCVGVTPGFNALVIVVVAAYESYLFKHFETATIICVSIRKERTLRRTSFGS